MNPPIAASGTFQYAAVVVDFPEWFGEVDAQNAPSGKGKLNAQTRPEEGFVRLPKLWILDEGLAKIKERDQVQLATALT